MSLITRSVPPTLIPNTGTYLWGATIRKLPITIAQMTPDTQEKFMQALRSTKDFSFRILSQSEKESILQKKWAEIEKTVPKGHYTEKIFMVIKTAGAVFLIVVSALEFRARL